MIVITNEEELTELLEEQGLEHDDPERLAEYISLVSYYNPETGEAGRRQILEEKLSKWLEYETESYYGTHDSPAEFAKYFYENYDTESKVADYLEIDWQRTWSENLRFDFYFAEQGYVWAEVY